MDALLAELYSALKDNRTTSYNSFAATALLIYETIVTSGQEITLIWRSSWSFVNVMYLLIRYYALIYLVLSSYVSINTNLSQKFCGQYDVFQSWGTVTLLPVIDILIILRIYALYHRSKKIGVLLVVLWLAETLSVFTSVHLGFKTSHATMSNPLPGVLPGCFPTNSPDFHKVLVTGAIASAFQAIYLGLTMYILYQQVQPHGLSLSPILKVFFRDGAAYCLILLVMYLANIMIVKSFSGPLQAIGVAWVVSVFAVTAGRLVLNMRASAARTYYVSGDLELEVTVSSGRTEPGQLTSIFDISLAGLESIETERGHVR